MTTIDKLRKQFAECRGDFSYLDFVRLIESFGYRELAHGKTSGSRAKYVSSNDLLMLDVPHDKVMKFGMVKRLQKQLREKGLL